MVSRLLEDFADRGLVTLGRKRIAIEDPSLIESVLGGR
jgi:CRP-like cAMP-binding protein